MRQAFAAAEMLKCLSKGCSVTSQAGRSFAPELVRATDDPFIRKLSASRKKWIVLQDQIDKPRLLLNADAFLRDFLILKSDVALSDYCHVPAVVTMPGETLDEALGIFANLRAEDAGHDETVILLWSPGVKRMITGSDVLRCLLSGMGTHETVAAKDVPNP